LEIDIILRNRFATRSPTVRAEFQRPICPNGKPAAVCLGQRAVEIAFRDARELQRNRPADWAGQFDRVADVSRAAEKALNRLITVLGPGSTEPEHLWRALATLSAGLRPRPKDADGLRAQLDEISTNAATLLRARDVIAQVKTYAECKSTHVSRGRKNDPHPEVRQFVFRLAEMWTFLMGQRPGKAISLTQNPFLGFARARKRPWPTFP
jgi:hypothetical protein